MTYDIITVNWKPAQTRIWRYWAEKHCPTANIRTIPDRKPVPWCWSGGKIACFAEKFETDRIIYMDTDIIVTHDLEEIWDMMGESSVGVSLDIPAQKFHTRFAKQINDLASQIGYNWPPHAMSSGFIALKGYSPHWLYQGWLGMMEWGEFHARFRRQQLEEEFALALWLSHDVKQEDVWNIPLSLHGNICGGRNFGGVDVPWAIHYHRPNRLQKYGMDEWLKI